MRRGIVIVGGILFLLFISRCSAPKGNTELFTLINGTTEEVSAKGEKPEYDTNHLIRALTEERRLLRLKGEMLEEHHKVASYYGMSCNLYKRTTEPIRPGPSDGICYLESKEVEYERLRDESKKVVANLYELCRGKCPEQGAYQYFGYSPPSEPDRQAHEDVLRLAHEVTVLTVETRVLLNSSEFYSHAVKTVQKDGHMPFSDDPVRQKLEEQRAALEKIKALYPEGIAPEDGEERAKTRKQILAEVQMLDLEVTPH